MLQYSRRRHPGEGARARRATATSAARATSTAFIHEGNGTAQLYIDERANPKQREAIIAIWSGQAKGSGPFALFASTFKYVMDPQFAKIQKMERLTSTSTTPAKTPSIPSSSTPAPRDPPHPTPLECPSPLLLSRWGEVG
jgi:hypothetical protein